VTGPLAGPLIETKLHAPARRPSGVVQRTRLTDRLAHIGDKKLTLVSAPAGFGKSTLITEWLMTTKTENANTAWLSLDQRDNDPSTFWTYVLAALERAAPTTTQQAQAQLDAGQPSATVLTTLVNALQATDEHLTLVLDDYHVIESTEIQDAMAFLLDHLPPQLHLVLTSRADPALPLARLRVGDELLELRAADLRFTPDEAATYLNQVMGLELAEPDVIALEGRTEGWIAALQLAALSMQGRDDPSAFIATFAGDDRYIVDYLVGEVLQQQPDDVRDFLLRTSILTRLNGSLCDAVTDATGDHRYSKSGQAMLEALDRANLFLVPLDDRRYWYRYHHLFADVLRARLHDEHPDLVSELHRRASDWHEDNADRPEAIRHALAGADFDRAADLIELAGPGLRQSRQEDTLRRWLEALPAEVFENRPVLAMGLVGARMATGDLTGVERLFQIAERWTDGTTQPNEPVVVDTDSFASLASSIAMHRAGQARLLGDLPATKRYAQQVLDLAAADAFLARGGAAALLGLAHWADGDLVAADHWYSAGMDSLEQAGHTADLIAGAVTVANIHIAQGRLTDAMDVYQQGLRRATEPGRPVLRGAPDMHVGIAELLRERNDLAGAHHHLSIAQEMGEHAGFGQHPYRWRVARARLHQADGNLDAAVRLLDEAEPVYDTDFSPEVEPVPAVRARVYLAQGRIDEARRWAHERHLTADDPLTYVREYEHVTLARILFADTRPDKEQANRLLDRLLAAAEDGKRGSTVIELLILQSLSRHANGERSAAHDALDRALTLAEPEGYVRLFLDEGPPMLALLADGAERATSPAYGRRLLEEATATEPTQAARQGLVDPLSERELDVLRLLRSDLDGPAIARELVVSLNTMRTHTKAIFSKLGVNSRRTAVRRADELGL
jgi:LuxR family maltose regulon positive regulatory protein